MVTTHMTVLEEQNFELLVALMSDVNTVHYEWVKKVYDACKENDVQFIFGQTGNIFIYKKSLRA